LGTILMSGVWRYSDVKWARCSTGGWYARRFGRPVFIGSPEESMPSPGDRVNLVSEDGKTLVTVRVADATVVYDLTAPLTVGQAYVIGRRPRTARAKLALADAYARGAGTMVPA